MPGHRGKGRRASRHGTHRGHRQASNRSRPVLPPDPWAVDPETDSRSEGERIAEYLRQHPLEAEKEGLVGYYRRIAEAAKAERASQPVGDSFPGEEECEAETGAVLWVAAGESRCAPPEYEFGEEDSEEEGGPLSMCSRSTERYVEDYVSSSPSEYASEPASEAGEDSAEEGGPLSMCSRSTERYVEDYVSSFPSEYASEPASEAGEDSAEEGGSPSVCSRSTERYVEDYVSPSLSEYASEPASEAGEDSEEEGGPLSVCSRSTEGYTSDDATPLPSEGASESESVRGEDISLPPSEDAEDHRERGEYTSEDEAMESQRDSERLDASMRSYGSSEVEMSVGEEPIVPSSRRTWPEQETPRAPPSNGQRTSSVTWPEQETPWGSPRKGQQSQPAPRKKVDRATQCQEPVKAPVPPAAGRKPPDAAKGGGGRPANPSRFPTFMGKQAGKPGSLFPPLPPSLHAPSHMVVVT